MGHPLSRFVKNEYPQYAVHYSYLSQMMFSFEYFSVKMGQYQVLLLFIAYFQNVPVWSQIRFASIFQDQMMLQREPESAIVFGFDAFLQTSQAFVSCSENGVQLGKLVLVVEVEEDGSWRSEIPPQAGGSECDITVVNGDELSQEEIHLKQVNFNMLQERSYENK